MAWQNAISLVSQTICRRGSQNAYEFCDFLWKSFVLTDDVVNPTVPGRTMWIGTNRIVCFSRPFAPGGPIAIMILLKIVYVFAGLGDSLLSWVAVEALRIAISLVFTDDVPPPK